MQNKQRRKNRRQKPNKNQIKRRSFAVSDGEVLSRPGPFCPTIKYRHSFRVQAATAITGTYSGQNLLDTMLYSYSATATLRPIQAIRLRRVQIWAPPAAIGAAQSGASLEWEGSQSPSVLLSDQAMGVTPAYIDSRPPKNSTANWWFQQGGSNLTTNLFNFACSLGGCFQITVDIHAPEISELTAGLSGTGLTFPAAMFARPAVANSGTWDPIGYTLFTP